ncbi:MAG: histidine kinase N-terminal 7TM domain-containing protein [Candidatus Faecivicinus sp.]
MPAAKHESLRNLGIAAGLFILAGVFRQVDPVLPPLPSALCFLMTNFLYLGLAFAWGISISRRILHRGLRRQLMLGCAMVVLWLLLRAVKYRFFELNAVTRYLWYLYYVPQILAPLFSFFAALQVGQREDAALCAKWYLLLIPAALLIGGILTNDLHQLAFGFAPDWANWGSDYSHGPLYCLAMAWTVCFLLAAMGIIYRKCRISESRSCAWIPLCVFIAGIALSLLSFMNLYTFHKMPECICLTFIALWESCLQVGLLPTNNRYLRFFSEAAIAAQIADRRGQVLYRAKSAPQLTLEQMQAADRGAILLNPDTRLQSAPVHDGHVYWVEDLTQVNRMKEQLEEIHARLAEENELIRAETELKRQQAQIEEKNRLFDHISRILRPQLNRMDEMLASGQRHSLQLVCILGAYVKRRGNLVLICEKDAPVSAEELAYCIRESLIYLSAYGVVCAFHQEGKGSVSGAALQTAYDFFEDCLEAALPSLSALMVRVECGKVFSIRLMMEDAAGLPDMERYAGAGELTTDQSDGELCLTLDFAEGGALP